MDNKNSRKKIKKIFLLFTICFFSFCVDKVLADTISIVATVPSVQSNTPVTPSVPPSSGGGGGGSSLGPSSNVGDSVVFKGVAYPGSTVKLTKDGVLVATVPSAPDASFEILLNGLSTGTYNFGVQAIDSDGRNSLLMTYTIYISSNVTTTINGLLFPPTVDIDKAEVKRGDFLTVVGRSAPNSKVDVLFNSETNLRKQTLADKLGLFIYKLDTSELEYGDHEVKAKTSETSYSPSLGFKVGYENILLSQKKTNACSKYDISCDKKINLADFSILVYWFSRPNPPKKVDLNGDGKVNLADFSILAYNWRE